jgi:hypothetical protein
MADGLVFPQDFTLESCKIITSQGNPFEFRFMMIELNYFEDLYNNTISGNMFINDSSGFLSLLGFNGNEFLSLKFGKPGSDDKINRVFRIFKVSDRRITKDTNENYILHFTSEETLLSEQYKISKSYPNKKVSEIVIDIMTNDLLVDPKKFELTNVEETLDVRDIVVPLFTPFEAINWLATQAISKTPQTQGSPYLFYENFYGFNFKSLQSLFDTPIYGTYKYEPKNLTMPDDARVQDMGAEIKNILVYEMVSNFDTLRLYDTGAFANKLIAIDTIRSTYSTTIFDYDLYFQNAKKLNPYGIMSNYKNRKGDAANTTYDGVTKTVTTNTGQSIKSSYIKSHYPGVKDINIEVRVPYRTAQFSQINYNKYKVSIPGDPKMTVGNVIEMLIPDMMTNDKGGRDKDKYYAGKYLVTAVRHKIDQDNKFITLMELSKESLPNPYDAIDNESPAWKEIKGK